MAAAALSSPDLLAAAAPMALVVVAGDPRKTLRRRPASTASFRRCPFAGKEIPPSNGTPRSAGMYGLLTGRRRRHRDAGRKRLGLRSFEPAYAVTGPQSDRREIEERYSTTSERAYRSPPPQSARAHYKSRAAGSVDSAYDTWLRRGTKHGGYGRPSEFPLEHVTRPPKQRPPVPPAPYWWYESP